MIISSEILVIAIIAIACCGIIGAIMDIVLTKYVLGTVDSWLDKTFKYMTDLENSWKDTE